MNRIEIAVLSLKSFIWSSPQATGTALLRKPPLYAVAFGPRALGRLTTVTDANGEERDTALLELQSHLFGLQRADPSLLRKLRHALQSRDDIRTVLASTIRLWALAELREDTSPFLHGFTPPLYIERFSDEEAQALIEQSHLSPQQRPDFADGVVGTIPRLRAATMRSARSGVKAPVITPLPTIRLITVGAEITRSSTIVAIDWRTNFSVQAAYASRRSGLIS